MAHRGGLTDQFFECPIEVRDRREAGVESDFATSLTRAFGFRSFAFRRGRVRSRSARASQSAGFATVTGYLPPPPELPMSQCGAQPRKGDAQKTQHGRRPGNALGQMTTATAAAKKQTPVMRAISRPWGSIFSAKIRIVRTTIARMFTTPTATKILGQLGSLYRFTKAVARSNTRSRRRFPPL